MAFTDFSNQFYVQTLGTGETLRLGEYTTQESLELSHVLLTVFKHGTLAGSETLAIEVYGGPLYEGTPLATSASVSLSSVSFMSQAEAIGNIRFDFLRQNLQGGVPYYYALTSTGYTQNRNTFYLGAVIDWPAAINTYATTRRAAALRIVGYRELQNG